MGYKIFLIISFVFMNVCISFGDNITEDLNDKDVLVEKIITVSAPEDSNGESFERLFLVSSQLNVVYENAVGFLHDTLEFKELESSIEEMKTLISNNENCNVESMAEFFDVLSRLNQEFAKNASDQEIDLMYASLSDCYKNVVNELNNYID